MTKAAAAPILLVGNFLSGSRPYRLACEELADRLAQRGWTVLRTSEKPGKPARLLDMMRSAWSWRRRYRAAQVDVFSGPAFLWARATCWVLRRARKPYVLTLRGGNLPSFAASSPAPVRRLLGSARAVTAPSPFLARELSGYRGDVTLIPNALDVAAYPFRVRRPARPSLVWLRAFHEIYNPGLAVEVLQRLAPEFPEIRLTMIGFDKGDGTLAKVRAAAERLGVADRLDIVPGIRKHEVGERLARADVFLNTTNVDNTPVSVVEAMACGLCVVTTNVGGVPDLVEDGRTGLLVPPNSPDAMAAAVRRVLLEPALAERLSSEGRREAEGRDWTAVLPMWESLLQTVIADGR